MDYRQRCYRRYDLQWDQMHSSSDNEYELYYKRYRKSLRHILPGEKSASILDVACGTGHFLYLLKRQGYTNYHGIDVSGTQINAARNRGILEVEEADLFDYLPKYTNRYDMIIAFNVIEHLTKNEVMAFLDMLYGSLKPGGKILIHTDNAATLFASAWRYIDFTHEVGFTPSSLTHVFKVCRFTDVMVFGDEPVAYDFKSFGRKMLWMLISKMLMAYLFIETGTGRGGTWKREIILEPWLFATGSKTL